MKYSDFKPGQWGYRLDNDGDINIFLVQKVNNDDSLIASIWYIKTGYHPCFSRKYENKVHWQKYTELRLATSQEIALVYPEYRIENNTLSYEII